MTTIRITVLGLPKPAGSKRAFLLRRKDGSMVKRADGSPVINVTDDCKGSKDWKQQVAAAAFAQTSGRPTDIPLAVSMTFVMPRPKGHFGSGKNRAQLRESAPAHPTSKPDVLKLARAAEDALTGIVYRDDAQTVELAIRKRYGSPPRCEIVVQAVAGEGELFG